MPGLVDVRQLSDAKRAAMALRIQVADDFTLPDLKYWNYDACRQHRFGWQEEYFDLELNEFVTRTVTDRPKSSCRACGIYFRKHQRIGITWTYVKGRGLIADSVGTGKTIQAAGLIAILKETGEIDEVGKVVVCPRPAALMQWRDALARMIPCINVVMASGTKAQRLEKYSQPWDVLLLGPMLLHNDYDVLVNNFPFSTLIVDDVDALRHRDTQTAATLKRLGRRADRMVVMTGTPLQKKLQELHSVLDPLGGIEIFGSEYRFLQRYTRQEKVELYNPKIGRKFTKVVVTGHRRIPEFVQLMAPMVLRRTANDINDVNLPIVMPPNNVYLDLHPAQTAKYKELKKGVLEIIKTEGNKITRAKAQASVHSASMICGGLSVLGEDDGPGTSVKLDWVIDKLTGDLETEKVVIFMKYINGIKSLQARLTNAGIGYETVWGEEPDKNVRARSQERFWQDPTCRVLMGTSAIEQSLNLQCARHLINFDLISNPGRMEQLLGRIRRDGSEHAHVFVHNLLCSNTHEMRLLPMLEAEQALVDSVWSERSELFSALTPLQLMQLIAE